MKRMNVREFRQNVSHLGDEPIEVVRYSETIGFWTPIALTTEPVKSTTKKWSTIKASKTRGTSLTPTELDDIIAAVAKFKKTMAS